MEDLVEALQTANLQRRERHRQSGVHKSKRIRGSFAGVQSQRRRKILRLSVRPKPSQNESTDKSSSSRRTAMDIDTELSSQSRARPGSVKTSKTPIDLDSLQFTFRHPHQINFPVDPPSDKPESLLSRLLPAASTTDSTDYTSTLLSGLNLHPVPEPMESSASSASDIGVPSTLSTT